MGARSDHRAGSSGRYVPLFWRLFLPNAAVLTAAGVVLAVEPANGRVPALAGGLATMLVISLTLMRRAFAPLNRLRAAMARIDPLSPGERIPIDGPPSEVTQLTSAFNDMLDRLEAERRDSALRAQSAQEQERRRLAAELHDEIGQSLTALMLQLRRNAEDAPPELRDDLYAARRLTASTLEDVRRLARDLRPEALDQLGLVAALSSLCRRFSDATGLEVDCSLDRGLPPLGSDADLVIYRVAQESLTNVVRHANATRAALELSRRERTVELRVRDDGVGVAGASRNGGTGIRGMRERALLVGAEVLIDRAPGRGTEVRMRVPLGDGE